MLQFTCTLVIPNKDNDGIELTYEQLLIENRLLAVAGGLSIVEQAGKWCDNGTLYFDESKRYIVTVDSADKVAQLREVAVQSKEIARQLAIYFSVATENVEFL